QAASKRSIAKGSAQVMTPLQVLYLLLGPEYRVDAQSAPRSGPNVYALLSMADNEAQGMRYDEHMRQLESLSLAAAQPVAVVRAPLDESSLRREFDAWVSGRAVKPRIEFGQILGQQKNVPGFARLLQQLSASEADDAAWRFFGALDPN